MNEIIIANEPKNVDTVQTGDALFRVIRSDHNKISTEEIGASEILCIEMVLDDFLFEASPRTVSGLLEYTFNRLIQSHPQFSSINDMKSIKYLCIVDAFGSHKTVSKARSELMSSRRKLIFGSILFALGLRTFLSGKGAERIIGSAQTAVGAYIARASAAVALIERGYKGKILSRIERDQFIFSFAIRNLIIANKTAFVAKLQNEITGKKPTVALAVGAKHGLVTEALKMTFEERERLFKELLDEALKNGSISNIDKENFEASFNLIPVLDMASRKAKVLDIRSSMPSSF